jgi:hypothetical protein
MRKVIEKGVFDCGDGAHQVVTLESENASEHRFAHRATPCQQCPWRTDVPTGVFPVTAYKHSASTAYDGAMNVFSCHMHGKEKPATCAGFLMRGADHNLGVRFAILKHRYNPAAVSGGGVPLYKSYRAMAVANGVSPDDPVLDRCRGVDEDWNLVLRGRR